MTKDENLMRMNLIRFFCEKKKKKLILTLKMVVSNTSKRWEESNLFENYWFPFGFYHLLRNVLYVNSCLCGFDHFGPHPAIASDQPFCLELPNPCELIGKPQTQPFSPLRQNPLTDVTGSFISGLRGALFFSISWSFLKFELTSKVLSHSKKVVLSSCQPIKDGRKWEADRWADMDVAPDLDYSKFLILAQLGALSGERTVFICSCSSFSGTQHFFCCLF